MGRAGVDDSQGHNNNDDADDDKWGFKKDPHPLKSWTFCCGKFMENALVEIMLTYVELAGVDDSQVHADAINIWKRNTLFTFYHFLNV